MTDANTVIETAHASQVADVMIYIGDLAPVFSSAATAIRPRGLLAFSTERSSSQHFMLQPSSRFAHTTDYVRSLASQDFEELSCIDTTLRLEANRRVPGQLFLFRRKS